MQSGLGQFSANYNTLLNPMDKSAYLGSLPLAFEQQYEGFAYLGLGGILLLICALLGKVIITFRKAVGERNITFRINYDYLAAFCNILVLALFAASPVGTFNSVILYDVKLPESLVKLFSIFRATGRFIWPVMYTCTIWACIFVIRNFRSLKCVVLIIALVLQISDFSGTIKEKRDYFSPEISCDTVLKSEAWEWLGDKEELIFMTSKLTGTTNDFLVTSFFSDKVFFNLAYYAGENNMTMNDFYVGRRNVDQIDQYKEENYKKILNNEAEKNAIYLFSYFPMDIIEENKLNVYNIDGIYVGIVDEIPENLFSENCFKIDVYQNNSLFPAGNTFIINGINVNHKMTLFKDGVLYGPYITLPSGTYEVEISGAGFDSALYDVFIEGDKQAGYENIFWDSNTIRYKFHLNETVPAVEFRVFYTGDTELIITDIQMKRIEE